jgi:hypothetical protein
MNDRIHTGYLLAIVASVLLLADGLAMAGATVYVASSSGLSFWGLHHTFQNPVLPLVLYAIWGLGIFGTVGAIISLTLFGFRARWFWSCLVGTACLWLVFPPIHTLLGVLALIILISHRKSFPHGQEPITAAP